MQPFSLLTPQKLYFGAGEFERAGKACAELQVQKALIVTGSSALRTSGHIDQLKKQLDEVSIAHAIFDGIGSEPTTADVDAIVVSLQDLGCDGIIALGGGSILDASKAAAAVATNGGTIADYIEGGRPISESPMAFVALPTTSGTGSEVTKNAVIISKTRSYKKSIRSDNMLPNVAIVDPALTLTCPPEQTANSGMDALCQLIESYVTKKHNPIVDALALQGIRHAGRSLIAAVQDGTDLQARTEMSLASVLGGICLANAGLGAVHGFAGVMGVHFELRHGLICGILLPHVMRLNLSSKMQRFCDIAEALTGQRYADVAQGAKAAVQCVEQLNVCIGIPADFKPYNLPADMLDTVAAETMVSTSLKDNPVELSKEELRDFLAKLI